MKRFYIIGTFILIITFLFACNKEEQLTQTCPVEYQYTEASYKKSQDIEQRWRFVGFEDNVTKEIQDPPCRSTPIVVVFADTLHENPNSDFYLPYLMKGTMLINKFTTSYEVAKDANGIEVSRVIASQVKGQSYVKEFEDKMLDGIERMNSYEIEGNTLRLKNEMRDYCLLFYAF